MRILMTTDTVGGVWTYTQELVLGLLDADPALKLLLLTVGASSTADQHDWLREVRSRNTDRFQFQKFATPLEWEPNNAAVRVDEPQMLKAAREFAPDLLHSNQYCYGAMAVQCPRLVVAHSDVLSWHDAVHGLPPGPSSWLDRYKQLVHRGVAGTDALIAPTLWMLQAFGAEFGLPARARVIANGIALHPELSRKRGLQAITAGRLWDRGKNIAMLQTLEPPMPLLIAGQKRHNDATLAWQERPDVHLLGPVPHHKLLVLLLQSSLYVSTAVYEPFGLSALEAARSGCALLSMDIPSMREVWGDAALYFRGAAELQALLERLATEPETLAAAQRRSVAASRKYTRRRMAGEYLSFYRELLAIPTERETAHA
ncbi:glycosyltransferase [Terriglobus sp.]|uniref:glycosyltransferase n=1 Tax=Terriglobus sp. TaxID=1889013 RepID=UPI003B008440